MFVRASGMPYKVFLTRIHEKHLFDWYLEIGCRFGTTFAPVRGKCVAVDPFFKAKINIIGQKPALHILQQTSDAFFESGFLHHIGAKLSFSFLDGMHYYEFLLRDFIGTEKASHAKGVIAMHDCVPFNLDMTTRDLVNRKKGAWTGDVWKLIPILKTYRPDLTLTVLNAAPTGLVLVSGLDPQSTVLQDNYDKILAEFDGVSIENYGLEKFYGDFVFARPAKVLKESDALFGGVILDETDLKVPTYVSP